MLILCGVYVGLTSPSRFIFKAGNRVHSATEPEQAVWEVQFGLEESKWVGERYDLAVDIRDVSGVPTNSKHVPNIHQPPSFTIRNLW